MGEHPRMYQQRVDSSTVGGHEVEGQEGVGQRRQDGEEEDHDDHEDGVGVGEAVLEAAGREGYGEGRQDCEDGGYEQ